MDNKEYDDFFDKQIDAIVSTDETVEPKSQKDVVERLREDQLKFKHFPDLNDNCPPQPDVSEARQRIKFIDEQAKEIQAAFPPNIKLRNYLLFHDYYLMVFDAMLKDDQHKFVERRFATVTDYNLSKYRSDRYSQSERLRDYIDQIRMDRRRRLKLPLEPTLKTEDMNVALEIGNWLAYEHSVRGLRYLEFSKKHRRVECLEFAIEQVFLTFSLTANVLYDKDIAEVIENGLGNVEEDIVVFAFRRQPTEQAIDILLTDISDHLHSRMFVFCSDENLVNFFYNDEQRQQANELMNNVLPFKGVKDYIDGYKPVKRI